MNHDSSLTSAALKDGDFRSMTRGDVTCKASIGGIMSGGIPPENLEILQPPKSVLTGGCHSHRLYSHSCDRTQSTVNGQTALIGAVNGQCGVKKTVNVQIPVRNGPAYSAVIRSKPVGWVYTCTERLFPDLQARGLGLQFKYRDSFAGCHVIFGPPKYTFPPERIFQISHEIKVPPLKYWFPLSRVR